MKKLSFVMIMFFLMVFIGSNELERNKETDKGAKISLSSVKANAAPGDWCALWIMQTCELAGDLHMHYMLWENPNALRVKL